MLEQAETSAAIHLVGFIADGVAERAALPSQRGPSVPYQAMHLVGAGKRRPVNRAMLEVVVTANAIRRHRLIGRGITQHADLPAQCLPFAADSAMHLKGAGSGSPVDRAALIVPVMTYTVRGDGFWNCRCSQKAVNSRVVLVLLCDVVTRGRVRPGFKP